MSAIRFPAQRKYTTPEKFFDAIYKWLCRIAAQKIYQGWKSGEVPPAHEELVEYLDSRLFPHVKRLNLLADYQSTGSKHNLSGEKYNSELESAAAFALATSDPCEYFAEQSRRGRKSRRGPSYTPDMLDPLDGSTAAEQAERLGCSVRTVMSLRAKAKAEREALLARHDAFTLMLLGAV